MEETDFLQKRKQLAEFIEPNINSPLVRNAFLKVKRELFVPQGLRQQAYLDEPLSIGYNATISQPSTIAIMLEMLEIKEGQKVLEVGSGCGYVLALLSEIVGSNGKVFGIEKIKELCETAKKNLLEQGISGIEIIDGDGSVGLEKEAPFDRILVSAACPFVPKQLFDQLKEEGIAVAPVGDFFSQEIQQLKKKNNKPLKRNYAGTFFSFVPLKGKFGFQKDD